MPDVVSSGLLRDFHSMVDRAFEKDRRRMTAIEKAKRIGTYDAPDRSRQYPLDNPEDLKNAVHSGWVKIHLLEAAKIKLEADGARKDATIADQGAKITAQGEKINKLNLRLGRSVTTNVILTLTVIGLWEVVKVLLPHVLR